MKKFFKEIMFNNSVIKQDYEIVITAKHLAGNKWDSDDCPGYRAFKDALPSEVYENLPKDNGLWGAKYNSEKQWGSYKKDSDGELVLFNMMEAETDDEIIFKKVL